MAGNPTRPNTARLLPRLYVGGWSIMALLAAGYLGVLAARPDLVEGSSGRLDAGAGGGRQALIIGPLGSDEARRLETAVLALREEMSALRTTMARQDDTEQAIAARLAALEAHRPGDGSRPITTSSVGRAQPLPAATPDDRRLPGQLIDGHVGEPVATQDTSVPLKSTPVMFGPAEVATAKPEPPAPLGVQIATGPSADALRISWMLLSERHKPVLKDLEPRFVQSTSGSGPAYRLIVGPFNGQASVNRVCSALKSRRVPCGVTKYSGEPL